MSDNQNVPGDPLRLENISHHFGPVEVIRQLSLHIQSGEFLALVGPSGCGKTTLLNILSGFFQPSSGTITRAGKTRMVHQHDGLFPWLTVSGNINLGLRHLRDETDRRQQLMDLLSLIRLEGFADHYPHQLSGGMKQRVELARALAGEADVILMDEPFSALDYQARLRMRRELLRMLHERPRTVIFVTHDIEEAAQLADRVAVLSERPARIAYEMRIDLPQPRSSTDPVVVGAVRTVLEEMGLEKDDEASVTLVRSLGESPAERN